MKSSLRYLNRLCKYCFYTLFQCITLSTTSLGIVLIVAPQTSAFSFDSSDTITAGKTGVDHESIDLISDVLYARPSSTYSLMTPDGAYHKNIDYALGDSDRWYIGEQRFGMDALISGVLHNDDAAIEAGLEIFDWGFELQLSDGSFKDTGDPFHSTSLFVQSVSYGLLTLQESSFAQASDVVDRYLPALQSAAHWMIQEDIWSRGISNNSPYTHRNYIVGAALGLTGKLAGDAALLTYADKILAEGIALQRSDGVNPELGGHDSSYQMAGALAAMRWLTHFEVNPLAGEMTEMITQALEWEESMILATGEISSEGNTRTGNNQESSRSGQLKKINHREVIYGFAYWSSMTGDERWHNTGHQISEYYYADDSKIMANLAAIAKNPDLNRSNFSSSDALHGAIPKDVPESSYSIGLTFFLFFSWIVFPGQQQRKFSYGDYKRNGT